MPPPHIHDQLRRIKEADNDRSRKKITILGAGIAGLAAGYELTRLGHTVQILEASNRIGGRIWTHRFDDGTYGELGAMRIPRHHDYTRHYVAQLGLTLRRFVSAHDNEDCLYDIRKHVIPIRDARARLYPDYALRPEQRESQVPEMLGRVFECVLDQISEEEQTSLLTPHLCSDRLRELDRTSLGEFLRARAGEGAKELIGSCTGLDSFFDRAITMFLREEIEMKRFPAPRYGEQERLSEIVGGMDLLPKRLGKTIHDCIELNAEVIGIRSQNDGKVAVTISRGDQETVTKTCDVVLCTLPFSILWKIDISPPFSPEKMYAIRNLSYASSTKVLLHCSTRFWETNGGIYGGASQSDQLIRATYYPSDNAIYSGPPGLLQQYGTLYSGFAPNKYTARDSAVSKNPGVLLGSYAWGQDARRLGAMAPTERARTVIRMVSRFHPEIARPGIVDGHASMFWDAYKWSAGAFSFLQPGEHGTIYQSAIRPEGNVHFAGEHCSLQQAWIQGALVSALRAVEEIVAKP